MARSYTVQLLVDRVRLLTDTESDTHITDAKMLIMADHAYPRTWSILHSASPPEHGLKSAAFTSTADTVEHAFSTIVSAGDFWKVQNVLISEGSGVWRPLPKLNQANLQAYRAPSAAYSMKLEYIPAAASLTALSNTVDGINGWEEHMVSLMCQDVKMAKEEDPTPYIKKQREIEADMKKLAFRDSGQAERITRRRSYDPYYIYRNNIDGYLVRGANLELYYRSGYYAVP